MVMDAPRCSLVSVLADLGVFGPVAGWRVLAEVHEGPVAMVCAATWRPDTRRPFGRVACDLDGPGERAVQPCQALIDDN